ncbi:MAG: hypothetical protein AAGD04_05320 [Pseudomonadota bacterium]
MSNSKRAKAQTCFAQPWAKIGFETNPIDVRPAAFQHGHIAAGFTEITIAKTAAMMLTNQRN